MKQPSLMLKIKARAYPSESLFMLKKAEASFLL